MLAVFHSADAARRAMRLYEGGMGGAQLPFKARWWGVGVGQHLRGGPAPTAAAPRRQPPPSSAAPPSKAAGGGSQAWGASRAGGAIAGVSSNWGMSSKTRDSWDDDGRGGGGAGAGAGAAPGSRASDGGWQQPKSRNRGRNEAPPAVTQPAAWASGSGASGGGWRQRQAAKAQRGSTSGGGGGGASPAPKTGKPVKTVNLWAALQDSSDEEDDD